MRIIATSDLHYNIARGKAPTEQIARDINHAGGDVLLLLGDLAGTDLTILERAFALFDSFPGRRVFVPGNHELWAPPGGDSLHRYERELPDLCSRHGVHYLDQAPLVLGDVAIAGTMGWYDYTFRSASLGIPLRFYQAKVAPGSAACRAEYRELVASDDDIAPESKDLLCRWMDVEHVRLGCSDCDLVETTVAALRAQLASLSAIRTVVVGMHHLPFAALVPRSRNKAYHFATAFLGSELFGETILEHENVRQVVCGHSHHYSQFQRNGVTATAIGSTYTHKRFESLDV